MLSTAAESGFIAACLEGFLYGKISVLGALTCTLAKQVQLFPGLGLYSGIFVIYLRCPSNNYRTAIILFYVLCLLHILSTATIISDIVALILEVSDILPARISSFLSVVQRRISTLSLEHRIDSQSKIFLINVVQNIASGCSDFIAQCIIVSTHKPLYLSSVLFT